jgi:hypothetical protein
VILKDEDIGSRVEVTKLPQVLIAEKRLEECLLSSGELLNTLCQISEHTDAQDLCGDIREHFKYYHIDLKNEARTILENASANLLRGYWYREKLAKRIACKLTGSAEGEGDEEDDKNCMRTGRSLLDLEEWIRGNRGFNDPNEGCNAIVPSEDADENIPEDYHSGSDSDFAEAFNDSDHVKRMEHFIFGGTSFAAGANPDPGHNTTLLCLRRTLMTLPKEYILFHSSIHPSWFDKLRNGIESRSYVQWDWWPLSQPQISLQHNQLHPSTWSRAL